jgi:hypothetical protein
MEEMGDFNLCVRRKQDNHGGDIGFNLNFEVDYTKDLLFSDIELDIARSTGM